MEIIKAQPNDLETVYETVQKTIAEIYPRYYPQGAVDFFAAHHCRENILRDIDKGEVYLLNDGVTVGTVTLDENWINRLFVLPEYQGKGYGRAAMDFAEGEIFKAFDFAQLHSSLPGQNMYLNRGYTFVEFRRGKMSNGDWLCNFIMKKTKA